MDGVAYEWLIRKKPTYSQAALGGTMNLAIQSADEDTRCILVADLQVSRPDSWIDSHQTAVKPAMIRMLIKEALEAGWHPGSIGNFEYSFPINRNKP